MQELLDLLTQRLGPEVAGPLASRLDLDADQAAATLPAVGEPLVDGLRRVAAEPEKNLGLLGSLFDFLQDDNEPATPGQAATAQPGDRVVDLVEQIAGLDLDGLATQVAQRIGLPESAARAAVLFVAPKIFAFLRGHVQEQGLAELLQPLLRSTGGAKADALIEMIEGVGGLGSALDRLDGLFGKR